MSSPALSYRAECSRNMLSQALGEILPCVIVVYAVLSIGLRVTRDDVSVMAAEV